MKQIVYIEWVDASGCDAGWQDIEKIQSSQLIRSVGFLFEETEDFLSLVPHWEEEGGNCQGQMIIPRRMVKVRRVLW